MLPQQHLIDWLKKALARARSGPRVTLALRLYELLGRGSAIAQRASVLKDFQTQDPRRMPLFRQRGNLPWFQPPLSARMAIYEEHVQRLAFRAFPHGSRAPDLLIQVSCTGYVSPHAIQRVIARRGWHSRALHIGHMGCYAALPATDAAGKMIRAEATAGNPRARAGMFFAEMCSLHLRPDSCADEQIIINSLFGDGAICYDVSARERARSLALLGTAEAIVPGTAADMGWRLHDSAFAMTLSRDVPARISSGLARFVAGFLKKSGLGLGDIDRFAIHPGGPRVIEAVLRALRLPDDAAQHSVDLLKRRGNMSSVTLPTIWAALLEDPEVRRGELIMSLAFGPGLTLAANLMRKC